MQHLHLSIPRGPVAISITSTAAGCIFYASPWRLYAVGTGLNQFIRKMQLHSFKNGPPLWQVGNPFEVEPRVRRADGTYRDEFLSKQPMASVAT
jgi:hypothetical protein